jgi:hypothetical protein
MSMSAENFLIRPHVYDALSGEFRPPTDPEKRLHTIGRLAIAAVTKGDYKLIHAEGESDFAPRFIYHPSWAPHVTVQVDADFISRDHDQMLMSGIDLKSETHRGMYFGDAADSSDGVTLVIDRAQETVYYDLALGAELQGARAAATKAAQEFFSA